IMYLYKPYQEKLQKELDFYNGSAICFIYLLTSLLSLVHQVDINSRGGAIGAGIVVAISGVILLTSFQSIIMGMKVIKELSLNARQTRISPIKASIADQRQILF